jgi:hypothetical protein
MGFISPTSFRRRFGGTSGSTRRKWLLMAQVFGFDVAVVIAPAFRVAKTWDDIDSIFNAEAKKLRKVRLLVENVPRQEEMSLRRRETTQHPLNSDRDLRNEVITISAFSGEHSGSHSKILSALSKAMPFKRAIALRRRRGWQHSGRLLRESMK